MGGALVASPSAQGAPPPGDTGPPVAASPAPSPRATAPPGAVTEAHRLARRALRGQIARLDAELSDAFVTAFGMRTQRPAQPPGAGAAVAGAVHSGRLLDLGELEIVRDDLARRVAQARAAIDREAEQQAARRRLLEAMLLAPGHHRFVRISQRDLGEPGCGVWHVRPRLGLVGMLMGWWQVKLSSGCPLAGRPRPRPLTA